MGRCVTVTLLMTVLGLSVLASGCGKNTKDVSLNKDAILSNGEEITVDNENLENIEEVYGEQVTKEESIVDDTIGYDKDTLAAKTPIVYPFQNGSVHDPSVVVDNGTFYVFGSHLGVAKTTDLMNWSIVGSGVNSTNPVIENVREEMKEAFEWAKTNTFWAPDVIQLSDGRFYMYYCTCEGSSPLASLGVAVSDNVEGPYKDLGIFLKSGMGSDVKSEDGNTYNANVHPNVIDPCLFYDNEGKLWMVYGSYSGGIYILEMDDTTGFPKEKGYGKKLLGGNHSRIEAPYIMYSKETDYYYLFLTFGGLDSVGGYNMRVVRSKTPDGPYLDANDTDMIKCKGPNGTFFHDKAIEPYGVKLMGNFRFQWLEGEQTKIRAGYVSPGHNSAYYDEETGKYYLIFHTRFEGKGEHFEIRVHEMYMNEDGWPVVSPYRYVAGDTKANSDAVVGYYKYINHGKAITKDVTISELIELKEDNTITGAVNGMWSVSGERYIELVIDGNTYKGVYTLQWDEYGKKNVMTFSAVSKEGISIWGSGIKAME